jgi:hypothetical protein
MIVLEMGHGGAQACQLSRYLTVWAFHSKFDIAKLFRKKIRYALLLDRHA